MKKAELRMYKLCILINGAYRNPTFEAENDAAARKEAQAIIEEIERGERQKHPGFRGRIKGELLKSIGRLESGKRIVARCPQCGHLRVE